MGLKDVDKRNLSVEQQAVLEQWEFSKKQLSTLDDIESVLEQAVVSLDKNLDKHEDGTKKLGTLLIDIRETLAELDKEPQKMPDYSKPVVSALEKLEKSLASALNVKVEAPQVNVQAPDVNVPEVDLSGVEKVLKNDVPKAFKEAIKLVPQTVVPKSDYTPLLEKLEDIHEQLGSIDTATRLKPQFPNTFKATNIDGSQISGGSLVLANYDYIGGSYPNDTTEVYTFKMGGSGGTTVATVTVVYTDSTKELILSATRV